MRAIIVAGGHTSDGESWKRWVREGDLILGADGGAALALSWGLTPDLVIGDMDSLTPEDKWALDATGRQFIVHPRAKDETDLELALAHAVQHGVHDIVILGALGGRLDHTLANVLLLALPQFAGVRIRIADGAEEILLVRGGAAVDLEGRPGDIVSLLPVGGDAHGVTTTGLAWALERDTLLFGSSRGVSNEMIRPIARVELEHGYLLVVHGPPPP